MFADGARVDVTGTTKGKGTAGVMKRHGFHGVSSSHGSHRNHRKPGSIGACATPGRVFKGMKMAGRHGHAQQTTQSLIVHKVDAERGLLLISGAIPGPTGGLVLVRIGVRRGPDMTLSIDCAEPDRGEGQGQGAKVDLPAEIFDVETNIPLIHQVVVAQLAAARQGTHKTKTRGEVRGGGKKPYRQKGTGRARQGSTRAPQFAGGGMVHGPVPRDYEQRTPKKMKARRAARCAVRPGPQRPRPRRLVAWSRATRRRPRPRRPRSPRSAPRSTSWWWPSAATSSPGEPAQRRRPCTCSSPASSTPTTC